MSNELIKYLIEAALVVVFIIMSRYLIPMIKNKLREDKFNEVATWVKFAVLKAEQVLTASTGEQKKEYVISFMDELLEVSKIDITAEQLDVLIESAVKEMNIAQNKIKTKKTSDGEE